MIKNVLKAIPLEDINANTFDGTLKLLGTGLIYPCSILRIVNASDKDIEVSYDGVNGHDIVLTRESLTLVSQDNTFVSGPTVFPKGMKVWVNGLAGAGFVYLIGYTQYGS